MASNVNYFQTKQTKVTDDKNKTKQSNENYQQKTNYKKSKILNILLIGPRNSGKSTFINSIVNYLQYKDYQEAEQHDLTILIPSTFTVPDKNNKKQNFIVAAKKEGSKNFEQLLEVGPWIEDASSPTRSVRTYMFKMTDGIQIRLIDTPGNSKHSVDQGEYEDILNYISKLYYLHAICFVFKWDDAYLSGLYFTVYTKQIMNRLEQSAYKNIIFVFTNSLGGCEFLYTNILETLQDEIKKNVKNPIGNELQVKNITFYLNNDSLSYLAGIKKDLIVDGEMTNNYAASWNKSTAECWRLIEHVQKLEPYNMRNTNSVNESIRMICQLARPAAEVSQLINDNLIQLERHQDELLYLINNNIDELRKKLYIPVINLDVIKVTRPITVCTNLKCCSTYMIDEIKEVEYTTKCHNSCYLQNQLKDTVGSSELRNCYSMNEHEMCNVCGCSYKVHMHIYYMTKKVKITEIDDEVSNRILEKEDIIKRSYKIVTEINIRLLELQNELDKIFHYSAKLTFFLYLKKPADFCHSYIDYIDYLISIERKLNFHGNNKKLASLETLSKEFLEFVVAYGEKARLAVISQTFNVNEINNYISELYKLKYVGHKIKEMVNAQEDAMNIDRGVPEDDDHYSQSEIKNNSQELFNQNNPEVKNEKHEENKQSNNLQEPKQDSTNVKSNQNNPKRKQNRWVPNRGGHQQNTPKRNIRSESPPPSYDEIKNDSNQNQFGDRNNYNHSPGPYGRFNSNYPPPFQHPSYPYPENYYKPLYGVPYPGYYPSPPPPPHHPFAGQYPSHYDPPRSYGPQNYSHPRANDPNYHDRNPNNWNPPKYGPHSSTRGCYAGPRPRGGYKRGQFSYKRRGSRGNSDHQSEYMKGPHGSTTHEHSNAEDRPPQSNTTQDNSASPQFDEDFVNENLSPKLAEAKLDPLPKHANNENKNFRFFRRGGNRGSNRKTRHPQSTE